MILETERLTLRPWKTSDAESLYRYARDERVGFPAGWPPHGSVADSKEIIRTVFSQDGVFAVTLKGQDTAIGCIGLIRGAASNLPISDNEGEISYWIGVPFWGLGLIPEAMREIIRYGFDLPLQTYGAAISTATKNRAAHRKNAASATTIPTQSSISLLPTTAAWST